MRGRVWVEYDEHGVSKIFRTRATAVVSGKNIKEYPRKDAVEQIRRRIFERSQNHCEYCGKIITWGSMHMHEQITRGDGGEISIQNSVAICYDCHLLGEHGNRSLRFGERN